MSVGTRARRPVAALTVVASVVAGCASGAAAGHGVDPPACRSISSMSERQCRSAVRIAHREADRPSITGSRSRESSGWPAAVSTVAVALRPGTVSQPNIGPACRSGRLLTVRLIGSFPAITVPPPAARAGHPTPSTAVHGVTIEIDGRTLRPCLLDVQTGVVRPPAHSVIVFHR